MQSFYYISVKLKQPSYVTEAVSSNYSFPWLRGSIQHIIPIVLSFKGFGKTSLQLSLKYGQKEKYLIFKSALLGLKRASQEGTLNDNWTWYYFFGIYKKTYHMVERW